MELEEKREWRAEGDIEIPFRGTMGGRIIPAAPRDTEIAPRDVLKRPEDKKKKAENK